MGLFNGKGLTNTTNWNPVEAKDWFPKGGHYHWDEVFDSKGLVGHGPNNPHGHMAHLQIHLSEKDIIHIFFSK